MQPPQNVTLSVRVFMFHLRVSLRLWKPFSPVLIFARRWFCLHPLSTPQISPYSTPNKAGTKLHYFPQIVCRHYKDHNTTCWRTILTEIWIAAKTWNGANPQRSLNGRHESQVISCFQWVTKLSGDVWMKLFDPMLKFVRWFGLWRQVDINCRWI